MGVSQIIEGWRNHIIPPEKLEEIINLVSEERLAVCNVCEEHSSNKKNYKSLRPDAHCVNCGCTLLAKTKCLTCECPLKKWLAQPSIENETK